jgi:hypothetical protein
MRTYSFARRFATLAPPRTGVGASPIVLLGDSLSVGTGPHLAKLVPDLVVIAKSGASIEWMRSKAAEINALGPRLVLVMGGTNDLAGLATPSTVATRMSGLIEDIDASVIVGTIPTMSDRADKVGQYNAILMNRFDAAQVGDVISDDELADGVHPGPSGYSRMADAWVGTLQPRSNVRPFVMSMIVMGLGYAAYRMAS